MKKTRTEIIKRLEEIKTIVENMNITRLETALIHTLAIEYIELENELKEIEEEFGEDNDKN